MTKPICIYHGGCTDGFTAAWAVWSALGDGNIDFHPGHYGEDPPDVTGRDVIMVDFSYKRPVIEAMAERARSIVILDHHQTAAADLAGINHPSMDCSPSVDNYSTTLGWVEDDPRENIFAIFDMDRSGAQIAWDFFHPHQQRPDLVDYVADRDLWRWRLPFSREVSAWIYSWPMNFETWSDLDDSLAGDFRPEIHTSGASILRQHDKNVETLIRATRRQMVIDGQRVWVANVPHFMASDAGHLLSEGQPFAATYYDRDGARIFSLRSRKGGVDVAAIAAFYGGGGHRHAAGFQAAPGWEGDGAP